MPRHIVELLDWKYGDTVEWDFVEPRPDVLIMDSVIITNMSRRDRATPDEKTLLAGTDRFRVKLEVDNGEDPEDG